MRPNIVVIFQPSAIFGKCAIDMIHDLLDIKSSMDITVIKNPHNYSSFIDAIGQNNNPAGVFLFSHGDPDTLQFLSKKGFVEPEWWKSVTPINSFFGFGCYSANILAQDAWEKVVNDWAGYTDEIWFSYNIISRMPYKNFLVNLINRYSQDTSCNGLIDVVEELLFDELISISQLPGSENFRSHIENLLILLTCKGQFKN